MSKARVSGFTKAGYRRHARRFGPLDADLEGRTAVVSGATGGIGKAAAAGLARLGARVVLVGRSEERLHAATAEIGDKAIGVKADLSLMSEIRRLTDYLLEEEETIHILVNNVGVLLPDRVKTAESVEKTLATNLAGHFLLTNLLIPRLIRSRPSRVINVSSGGMYSEGIQPDDLGSERGRYRGAAAYARTKRGQVILTEMWAERLAGTGVTVHAMHPGWVKTAGVEESLPRFYRIMRPFLRSPEQGADTILWLAAADEPGETSGRFWFDRRQAPTHVSRATVESSTDRYDLWLRLSALTGSDYTN